ncbi:hypothetical protein JTB14_021988 [Gonioctena quinquepunctata]|nr:hypothetical protein JTB14_021988 [Gonioctena quinquepunctata]
MDESESTEHSSNYNSERIDINNTYSVTRDPDDLLNNLKGNINEESEPEVQDTNVESMTDVQDTNVESMTDIQDTNTIVLQMLKIQLTIH